MRASRWLAVLAVLGAMMLPAALSGCDGGGTGGESNEVVEENKAETQATRAAMEAYYQSKDASKKGR